MLEIILVQGFWILRFFGFDLNILAFFSPLSPFLLYFIFLFSLQVGLY